MLTVMLWSGSFSTSSGLLNADGSGMLMSGGACGSALEARTRSGENSVIVTGSLAQMKFRSRLCSQSTPTRRQWVRRCQMIESFSSNRRSRLSTVDECPIVRPAWETLIDGAPRPTQPGQSCASGAATLELTKKYDRRRSLTRVALRTLVNPARA